MYVLSTSGDECVHGNHGKSYPDVDLIHYVKDNKLCRWDDPTVYSEDGGKTWIDRPHGAVKLHPCEDYNCRCTVMAYWNEIVYEVDEQIDLLSENEDNIPNSREGLRILNQPAARSNNSSVQETQAAAAAQRLARNVAANEAFIQQHYPNEIFLSDTAQVQAINRYTKKITLPENVRIAESRITIKSNEQQRTLRKELRQAGTLSRRGNSVFLTPEFNAYKVRVTDAVVNGIPYEFRNVTGSAKKIEKRFGEAKEKGNAVNVYLNLENGVNINEARRRIDLVLERHPEYTGKIIVSTKEGKIYFWESSSFRKKARKIPALRQGGHPGRN